MRAENLLQKTDWRGRISRYAPLILWVGVIFFMSSGQASMSQTSRVIRPLLEFLFPSSPEETLIVYHSYIRKFAHFAEYAVLAFWAARAFLGARTTTAATTTAPILRKYWFAASFLLVLLVASVDETNQSFNPSRTGSMWDVALDTAGGAWMILVVFLFRYVSQKLSRRRSLIVS